METIQQTYTSHSSLLGKGLALSQLPTIHEALEGNLPFRYIYFINMQNSLFETETELDRVNVFTLLATGCSHVSI